MIYISKNHPFAFYLPVLDQHRKGGARKGKTHHYEVGAEILAAADRAALEKSGSAAGMSLR